MVELYGIPGSGKSFVAERLIESLRQDGIQIDDAGLRLSKATAAGRIIGKFGLVMRELLRNGRLLRPIFSFVSAAGVRGIKRKSKLVFNWLYLGALIDLNTGRNQIIVMDQGLCQALWSTFFYAGGGADLERSVSFLREVLSMLPVKDLCVVSVSASDELIKRRISSRVRGHSPLDRDLEGSWQRATEVTKAVSRVIERLIALEQNCKLVDIPNHDQGIAEQELNRIRQALGETARTGR